MFSTVLLLLLSSVPATVQAPGGSITVGEATGMRSDQLAKRFLPEELAKKVIKGTVRRQWLPGQVYMAVFREKAVPAGQTICRQRMHMVELADREAIAHPNSPAVILQVGTTRSVDGFATSYPALAGSARCGEVEGYAVPMPDQTTTTVAAIDQLTSAMRIAARTSPLPFQISCDAEDDDKSCMNSRAALAALPINVLGAVSFDTGNYAVKSFTPGSNGRPAIRVTQMLPPSEGRSSTPIVEFGPSEPDGKSWRVTLIEVSGRLQEIRMRRSTTIYH